MTEEGNLIGMTEEGNLIEMTEEDGLKMTVSLELE